MNVQRIKDLVMGGFKPFTIHMSDGRHFDVPHPEFIAVGRGGVVVIDKNDRVHALDALHITGIEEQFSAKGRQ